MSITGGRCWFVVELKSFETLIEAIDGMIKTTKELLGHFLVG